MPDTPAPAAYILGHSPQEMARLELQARLIAPISRRFLETAGITAGMRVLDVGCGVGDLTFLAAELVGPTGLVLGADRVPTALAVARQRAAAASLKQVTFVEGDPAVMTFSAPFDPPFDAVIGRYVLQFQPDPAAMLRALAGHLRPGGVLLFHELDWGGLSSYPPVPSFEACIRWGQEAMRLHGAETEMGRKLFAAFLAAGLEPPCLLQETQIAGLPACREWLTMFASLIETLLPEIERQGLATAAQIDRATLVERISAEASRTGSTISGPTQVGAWVRCGERD